MEAQWPCEKLEVWSFIVTNAIMLLAITKQVRYWCIYCMGSAATAETEAFDFCLCNWSQVSQDPNLYFQKERESNVITLGHNNNNNNLKTKV